jgi:hypothetical protein
MKLSICAYYLIVVAICETQFCDLVARVKQPVDVTFANCFPPAFTMACVAALVFLTIKVTGEKTNEN